MFSTTLNDLNNDWTLCNLDEADKKKLSSCMEADRKEIHSLFDLTVRKQVDQPIALNLLKRQQGCYLQIRDSLHKWANNYYHWILDRTPYFIDKDFIGNYKIYRHFTNPDIEIAPVLYLNSSDLKAIEDYFVEPLRDLRLSTDDYFLVCERNEKEAWFIKTDNKNGIHFNPEWYDYYVDNFDGYGEKKPHWAEIETLFTDMEGALYVRNKVKHFIETEFTPAIEQLEQMIPTATESKPPTPPQEIDSTDKSWKENYEAVVAVYDLFRKHLPILKDKGYIVINDKRKTFTWNLHKARKSDLARYFSTIKPPKSRALWQEICDLFGFDCKADTLSSYARRNEYSDEFDKIYKLLELDKIKH